VTEIVGDAFTGRAGAVRNDGRFVSITVSELRAAGQLASLKVGVVQVAPRLLPLSLYLHVDPGAIKV
jgi:hypothetical protein